MTSNCENKKEKREYGSISYNVYWQYLQVDSISMIKVRSFTIHEFENNLQSIYFIDVHIKACSKKMYAIKF